MCYKPAAPAARLEYVCPVCGEKTLYTNVVSQRWTFELENCRRLFKELPHHEAMALDESNFCRKCRPTAKEAILELVLRFDDGTTNVVSNVTSRDLRLLRDFLGGRLAVKDEVGLETTSIKQHLPRLRELLGLDKADKND